MFWNLLLTVSQISLASAQEGAGIVGGGFLPNYACPSTCQLSQNCYCASKSPPGNLDPKNIPQLMTLTMDDSVNSVIWPVINNLTSGLPANPNGCPLSATFFVSTQWTDFHSIQGLASNGHEIAVHTVNHVGNPPMAEIMGGTFNFFMII